MLNRAIQFAAAVDKPFTGAGSAWTDPALDGTVTADNSVCGLLFGFAERAEGTYPQTDTALHAITLDLQFLFH
jgi:hypothetical protein